jgi:hypothetical protein
MRAAKSARAFLGASLIAFALSVSAYAEVFGDARISGISTGSANGISTGSVDGISTGSAQGISTGSVTGISTGSIVGISTGSVDGISTGSAQGISTGSVAGISTGSILGISTGSVDGISTGSAQGISTGSVAGISTGSILGISTGSAQGISTGSVAGISTGSMAGSCLLLAGPVSQIDLNGGHFISLGQAVYADSAVLASLTIGDFVGVSGAIVGPGEIDSYQTFNFGQAYVPGATEVFVTGLPTAVDLLQGTTQIGGLTVDYTPALGSRFDGIGGAITVFGTQPVSDGWLLSRELHDVTAVIF